MSLATPKAYSQVNLLNEPPAPRASRALPELIADTWKSVKAPQTLTESQMKALPDGEIYFEYGLQSLTKYAYAATREKYAVEVFEMRFSTGAYGLFTFKRQTAPRQRHEFYAGRYLVSILNEGAAAEVAPAFSEALKQIFSNESGPLPPLKNHLPETQRISGSETYLIGPKALARDAAFGFLSNAVFFNSATEAISAKYSTGAEPIGMLIVEYHTPQLASDGYAKLQTALAALPANPQAKTLLNRNGNYVIVTNNVKDEAAANAILGQIKYSARVIWEGKDFRAIPLEFRPPDSAALEEAADTANILLRTFYWIGAMLVFATLLGILSGGSFFYWRRYQRRKRGLDDLFSDAGGTIQLNLDDFLLEAKEVERKLLGKGE